MQIKFLPCLSSSAADNTQYFKETLLVKKMEEHGQTEKTDHVAIEIKAEHDLVNSIKEKMEKVSSLHSVSRISDELYEGNQEKYFPRLVSIGPFHHGKQDLKVMEDLKWQYFDTLLNRHPNAERILDTCVKTLQHSEKKARKFYGEAIDMESDQFLEIMLVDGCFVIELFLEYSIKNLRRRDDPIFFSTNSKMFWLRCDMILLENQIPFWVLQKLFHIVVIKQYSNMSLMEFALCFFRKLLPGDGQIPQDKFGPGIHNFLDLIRHQYLPTMPQTRSPGAEKHLRRGATCLQLAGIRIRRAAKEFPLNIKFINEELQIPPFQINGYTEILFRNLIALERGHHQRSKTITSYAIFMASLIRTKSDARILRRKRILVHGSQETDGEILNLMKKLQVDINVTDFYYGEICRQINEHQNGRRTTCWQAMKDIYYKSEVGVVGLILAITFLVFLFTGIFFSIVAFLMHHFQ